MNAGYPPDTTRTLPGNALKNITLCLPVLVFFRKFTGRLTKHHFIMETLNHHLKYMFMGMVLAFVCALQVSCRSQQTDIASEWSRFYKDSVALELPKGNLDSLFMLNQVDRRIFTQASVRLLKTLQISGDTLRFGVQNGASIKIPENLFDYHKNIITSDNRKLRTDDKYEIRLVESDNYYFIMRKDAPENTIVKIKGAIPGVGEVPKY